MNEYIMYAYINKLLSSYQNSNYLTYLKLPLIQDDGSENETNLESTRCQETSATSPPAYRSMLYPAYADKLLRNFPAEEQMKDISLSRKSGEHAM